MPQDGLSSLKSFPQEQMCEAVQDQHLMQDFHFGFQRPWDEPNWSHRRIRLRGCGASLSRSFSRIAEEEEEGVVVVTARVVRSALRASVCGGVELVANRGDSIQERDVAVWEDGR